MCIHTPFVACPETFKQVKEGVGKEEGGGEKDFDFLFEQFFKANQNRDVGWVEIELGARTQDIMSIIIYSSSCTTHSDYSIHKLSTVVL